MSKLRILDCAEARCQVSAFPPSCQLASDDDSEKEQKVHRTLAFLPDSHLVRYGYSSLTGQSRRNLRWFTQ